MSRRKSKKSNEEIFWAIMDALPVRNYVTVEEIARRTGSSWETVSRWISLIMRIQEAPRVRSMKSPLGRGEVYSREREKHGAKAA
ncbi:hypothetical protein ISS40_01215 [Candidatus Bathyarchaeota archaeon]|nr:hypothetical protein [Candidatus Bathyarchaeota archaeon]MBL7167268.1 hypothetical protein [Candidatus Bathyarchaeota archaeon]